MLDTGIYKKPSLGQIDAQVDALKRIESVNSHWDLQKAPFYKISPGQFHWLKEYIKDGRVMKINSILDSLGIERKDSEKTEEAKMHQQDREKEVLID